MAGKTALKFRSVTYPNSDRSEQQTTVVRGKLKRMDSVDQDSMIGSACSLSTPSNQLLSPSTIHGRNRTSSHQRNLSLEGRLRVSHFQQTHSASSTLAPGKKLLRFSDGGLGRSGAALQSGLSPQVRSSSCLPLSKQRGSLSPRTSNSHLDRSSSDWQKQSMERPLLSPNRSQERNDHATSKSKSSKKLERYFSTDCPSSPRSPVPAAEGSLPTNPSIEVTESTSGNCDTRSRRSQFRRAISLFSLSCDKETERERREKTAQKILRPPTRHVYRRGVSGLPIECTSRSLGVVY